MTGRFPCCQPHAAQAACCRQPGNTTREGFSLAIGQRGSDDSIA